MTYGEVTTENGVDRYDCCDEITCPYCGNEETDSWECDFGDEGDYDHICGECGNTFLYNRSVEVSYSSWRKE